jgi:hypothetical protein
MKGYIFKGITLKKRIILFFPLVLQSMFIDQSEIHEIREYKDVAYLFAHPDPRTLFVFDVDDTLIINPTYSTPPKKGLTFDAFIKEFSRGVQDTAYRLIDPLILEYITSIQRQGVKVVGLTHCINGSFGMGPGMIMVPSLPRLRYEKLKDIGFDFSSSFENQEITFCCTIETRDFHPLYYKGILFTDLMDKGSFLGGFLENIGWTPRNVVFFDDKRENVYSVLQAMHRRNIPCEGFLYQGAIR